MALSPKDTVIAIGTSYGEGAISGCILVYRVSDGAFINSFCFTGVVSDVAFSPDGKIIAGGSRYQLALSFVDSNKSVVLGAEAYAWAFSPDGSMLANVSYDDSIKLWSIPQGSLIRKWKASAFITSISFSPDGLSIASGVVTYVDSVNNGSVGIWSVSNGTLIRTIQVGSYVRDVAWSPTGGVIASGDDQQMVRLWDPTTGAKVREFGNHTIRVSDIEFTSDGNGILSAGGEIKLWRVSDGSLIRVFKP